MCAVRTCSRSGCAVTYQPALGYRRVSARPLPTPIRPVIPMRREPVAYRDVRHYVVQLKVQGQAGVASDVLTMGNRSLRSRLLLTKGVTYQRCYLPKVLLTKGVMLKYCLPNEAECHGEHLIKHGQPSITQRVCSAILSHSNTTHCKITHARCLQCG